MDPIPLPIAAACTLDGEGLRAQGERYRRVGLGARLVERTPRRIAVRLDADVSEALVRELVEVERGCCPFFALEHVPTQRLLRISVAGAEHEGALAAIAAALDLPQPPAASAPGA